MTGQITLDNYEAVLAGLLAIDDSKINLSKLASKTNPGLTKWISMDWSDRNLNIVISDFAEAL